MIREHDNVEKIKLCDPYLKVFERCVKTNSSMEDVMRAFSILVNCEVRNELYIQK